MLAGRVRAILSRHEAEGKVRFAMVAVMSWKKMIDTSPITGRLSSIGRIELTPVSGTDQEPLWNELVRQYHYLGCGAMMGHRIKYLAFLGHRPIAALSWSGAARKLAARDQFVGWSANTRRAHMKSISNNSRFLVLPWVNIHYLASYLLSRNVRRLREDWPALTGHPLWMVETFVDPSRFTAACYRAANWKYLGESRGFGRKGVGYVYHGLVKEVYVYVVEPRFYRLIGCAPPSHTNRPSRGTYAEEREMMDRVFSYDPRLIPTMDMTEGDVRIFVQELQRFHRHFHSFYGRTEHQRLGLAYLSGLMSSSHAKSVEPIALEFVGKESVRSMQRFLKTYHWDHEAMESEHRQMLAKEISSPDGMLCVDSSEFSKKGRESVGVARQYCGEKGKVDNCQSGVFVGYSSTKGHGLLTGQLYMPEGWFEEEQSARREENLVPEDLSFKTKPQIAGDLISRVLREGLFPVKWVGMDAVFGADTNLLSSLPPEVYYLAQVRSNTKVFLSKPKVVIPDHKGHGRVPTRPRLADGEPEAQDVATITTSDRCQWKTVILAEGAKGPIISQVAIVRVYLSNGGLPLEKPVWLVLRKLEDGQIRYAVSNAPEENYFKEICQAICMRWAIEQCFQEGKSYLGMGQYEHRSWPAWHRHMIFVFLALHLMLRLRQRFKKKPGSHPPASIENPLCHVAPEIMESENRARNHPLPSTP